MGCDGGTIPKRDELVRTQKKPEQVDRDAETVAKWRYCAISQEELKLPIVSCELGKLYNKDAVIEYLLDKSSTNEVARHIRNLKDIMELKLTPNPSYKKSVADKGDEYVDRQAAEFICPVTGLEMNGKYKFCYIQKCGCVMSDRSLKEIKSDVCHKCGQKYADEDIIIINGASDEVQRLKLRMEERRLQAKLEKKSKKEAKRQKQESADELPTFKKPKLVIESSCSKSSDARLKNGAPESVVKELNIRGMVMSEEKLKTSYSVAKDPKATETFKSLFTSHDSCKKQPRAHWITYNPLYN